MSDSEPTEVFTAFLERTGVVRPRGQVHANGEFHVSAHMFVTDGRGNLVEQDRGPDCGQMQNTPDSVSSGGHMAAYEGWDVEGTIPPDLIQQALDTAIKETFEEIGLVIHKAWFATGRIRFIGITRTDYMTEMGWHDRSFILNFMVVMPDISLEELTLEQGKVTAVRFRHADYLDAIVRGDLPNPYPARPPDGMSMLAMVVDALRRFAQGL